MAATFLLFVLIALAIIGISAFVVMAQKAGAKREKLHDDTHPPLNRA